MLLDDLCELMTDGSLCAMGGLTPMPVRSAVRHFGEDFGVPATTTDRNKRRGHAMTLLKEPDFGTPARQGAATVEVTIDGVAVTRARRARR